MSDVVNIGFLPLSDAAALIAASDFGFAQAQGLEIRLHRDVSWANLRDKLMVGHYDAAHMLAPLALAATLGIGQVKCPLRAPFLLNLNGNGITISPRLLAEMAGLGLDPMSDWQAAARAVAAVVKARRAQGKSSMKGRRAMLRRPCLPPTSSSRRGCSFLLHCTKFAQADQQAVIGRPMTKQQKLCWQIR